MSKKQEEKLLRLMTRLEISMHKVLTNPNNFDTVEKIDEAFGKARIITKKLVDLSKKVFRSMDMESAYKDIYNSVGKMLSKGASDVSFSPLSADFSPGYDKIQDSFDKAMDEMHKMASFNLSERKKQSVDFAKTINEGQSRMARLERRGDVNQKQRDKLASDVASKFAPKTGVRKFRNEYYGLDKGSKDKAQFDKLWGGSWDELNGDMQTIIERGLSAGDTQRDINKNLLSRLEKAFPTETLDSKGKPKPNSTFPIPTRDKDGNIGIRRLGMKYYTELKSGYYASTVETEATVNSMLSVGADLVRYKMHGSQDHSEICQKMSKGGVNGVYSLSGQSAKYPELTVYPPAHYNCYSSLEPLPMRDQERVQVTEADQKTIDEKSTETPQDKKQAFDDTGGEQVPQKEKKSATDKKNKKLPPLKSGLKYGQPISEKDVKPGDTFTFLGDRSRGGTGGEIVKVNPKTIIYKTIYRPNPDTKQVMEIKTRKEDVFKEGLSFITKKDNPSIVLPIE